MQEREQVLQMLEQNRQAMIVNLAASQRITNQLMAITAECKNDEQFLRRAEEVKSLSRQQQQLGIRHKTLATQRADLEAQLQMFSDTSTD
jgi:hypothetical protein